MSAVRGQNTKPEIRVRQIVHSLGYRFRLHRKDLPGKPDIVFPSQRKTVFVHGCFWHQHAGCKRATVPQANGEFWGRKLKRNVERDAETLARLKEKGWKPLVVWECEVKDEKRLSARLRRFLDRKAPR